MYTLVLQSSALCFRPLTGNSSFLQELAEKKCYELIRFRPLTGNSSFLLTLTIHGNTDILLVFVPLRGIVVFYEMTSPLVSARALRSFSSPYGE